jgi:ribonuclease P protein component
MRRRLRAILREEQSTLPGGLLLIGAHQRAVELTFDQLRRELRQLLAKAVVATPLEPVSKT